MQCFFFSSRRRHTRWPRDWSSDVCSSDLKKSTSSESSRSAEASGSRAANGEQRRTGPKSNRTSTNGAPAQAESTPQAAGKADESGSSTTNPPVEGVNGSADAGAPVSTHEAD